MSSHHIVREKQEPALLVLGMDNFDDELLGQLLEWSPTLIATPMIAEKLISLGIKIDLVITDEIADGLQSDIKQLPVAGQTVITSALNYLIEKGYPAVNVVTDEFSVSDYLPFASKINLVIFHDRQKIYAVNPGFNKWKPAGETIKLLSKPVELKITGLEKAGESQYKTVVDGFFTLQFNSQFLLIAEQL
jgi:thiamine pyrophosphokinase